jgi:hypothetical protein
MLAVAVNGGGIEIGGGGGTRGVEDKEGPCDTSSREEGDCSELESGHSFSSVAENFLFIASHLQQWRDGIVKKKLGILHKERSNLLEVRSLIFNAAATQMDYSFLAGLQEETNFLQGLAAMHEGSEK